MIAVKWRCHSLTDAHCYHDVFGWVTMIVNCIIIIVDPLFSPDTIPTPNEGPPP